MSPQLTKWLGHMYRADVLGQGSIATTGRLARDAILADQSLRDEARLRIAELAPVVRQRGRQSAHAEATELRLLQVLVGDQ